MGSCLSIFKSIGKNIDANTGLPVEKSKKKGALWAAAAAADGLAILVFAILSVVGAALAISAFVTGTGAALGVFQLLNTITNIFLVTTLVLLMIHCIRHAHYHLGGRKIASMPKNSFPVMPPPLKFQPPMLATGASR